MVFKEIVFGMKNYLCGADPYQVLITFILFCVLLAGIFQFTNKHIDWWYLIFTGLYFTTLFTVTILSRAPGSEVNTIDTIFQTWILQYDPKGSFNMQYDIIGNVLIFVPEGFLLSIKIRRKIIVILVCMFTSIFIEWIQYYTGCGMLEIADMVHNVCGGLLGVVGWNLLRHWDRIRKKGND